MTKGVLIAAAVAGLAATAGAAAVAAQAPTGAPTSAAAQPSLRPGVTPPRATKAPPRAVRPVVRPRTNARPVLIGLVVDGPQGRTEVVPDMAAWREAATPCPANPVDWKPQRAGALCAVNVNAVEFARAMAALCVQTDPTKCVIQPGRLRRGTTEPDAQKLAAEAARFRRSRDGAAGGAEDEAKPAGAPWDSAAGSSWTTIANGDDMGGLGGQNGATSCQPGARKEDRGDPTAVPDLSDRLPVSQRAAYTIFSNMRVDGEYEAYCSR